MPSYKVNRKAVAHAKKLIDEGKYVVDGATYFIERRHRTAVYE